MPTVINRAIGDKDAPIPDRNDRGAVIVTGAGGYGRGLADRFGEDLFDGCFRQLPAQVILKRTPRLTFKADPAIAAGSRVEELLRGLDKDGLDQDGLDQNPETA